MFVVELEQKKEIVSILLDRGVILNREMLNSIDTLQDIDNFRTFILTQPIESNINFSTILGKYNQEKEPPIEIQSGSGGTVNILFSYKEEPRKRDVQDFVNFFSARYEAISAILRNRKELQSLTSISRLNQKKEKDQAAIIGLVTNKQETKTGKIMLTIEDPTGTIKAAVSTNSPEAFELAKETSLDEVIGVVGMSSDKIIFANTIVIPDVPLYKEMKKSPDEAYALFLGDFHFGSKVFLKEAFEKLIFWLRGEHGNENQREIVKKLKYIFMVGDLVEGVGIYPDQENDLDIPDIYEQYTEFAKHLRRIPGYMKIIVCPGNHDAMRLSEPQPTLYKDFAEAVWKMPNAVVVSNPSLINIHADKDFPGFDVLMYHGFSFPFYADSVPSIRNNGGQERVDLIMKYLLQRRHLAPTHTSTLYLPDQKDNLVIDKIPDFFATGHIHRVSATSYRNVTLLSCSCWLEKTEYQEKMGLHPQPGRAILVNLQTRKVKILNFYGQDKEEQDATQQV
jgi:DNA polymerase II small subunit